MRPLLLRMAGATGGAVTLALVAFLAVFLLFAGEVPMVLTAFIVGMLSLIALVQPEFGLYLLVMNSVAAYSVFFDMPRIGPVSIVIALQGVVLVAFLVHLSVLRQRLYLNVPENWFLFAYAVFVLLSIVLAERSSPVNYLLYRRIFLVGFMAFVLILQLINGPTKLRRMIGVLVLIDLMLVVSGVLNKVGLLAPRGMDPERIEGRTVGLLGNPNSLAFTLIGLFPLVLALLIQSPRLWVRVLLATLAVGNVFVILNTLSRGGFIALASSILFMGYRFGRDRRLLMLLAVVVVIAWILLPTALFDRFQEVRGLRGNDRYSLTMIGLNMAMHNPLFGVGYGNFELYFARYDTLHRGGATAPHNMYTSIASQSGFLSLALYLCVVALTWRRLTRLFTRLRAQGERFLMFVAVALQSMLVSLIVFGVTSHVEHEYLVFVILAMALVIDRFYGTAARAGWTDPAGESELPA